MKLLLWEIFEKIHSENGVDVILMLEDRFRGDIESGGEVNLCAEKCWNANKNIQQRCEFKRRIYIHFKIKATSVKLQILVGVSHLKKIYQFEYKLSV